MVDPFRKPDEESTLRQRLWNYVSRERGETMDFEDAEARVFLDWSSRAYHQRFLDWLQSQADAQIPIGDHMTLISGTARANAFREILSRLKHMQRAAESQDG